MADLLHDRSNRVPRRQLLPTGLRALILAAGYWVLSLSLTNVSGSVASFIGCLTACFLADHYLRQPPLERYRTGVVLAACAALLFLGLSASQLIVASSMLAGLFSPLTTYHLGEFIKWLFISVTITSALRTFALRFSWGAVIEIVFVASAFVITLSAHRNGMIHRPYFIGDFALMRGIDPSAILMAFGCGAVLCLAALLMVENNHRRLPWHFGVLGMLCFSLLAYVQFFGLPTPSYTDDLGLTGAEMGAGASQEDNPFRDGENNADNLQAPVAIVLFRDDYQPLNGSYYFRETAYSQWNGNLLDVTNREDMDRDLIENFTNTSIAVEDGLLNETATRRVRTSVGMLTPHRRPFGLESPDSYTATPNPNNLRFKRTYDVESLAPDFSFDDLIGQETGADDWSDEVWEEYLRLPDDRRYQQLAEQLIGSLRPQYADDPFARAFTVKSYLDENGIYSLKNAHAYEQDPAASFLFGDLTGYCMHFAFAATYMYRSLGIPARVGIGYSVPASNRAGGSALLIQAIHGHAWPEVYFKDYGWVIIDPAPQQTLVDMSTDPQNSLQQLLGDMLRNEASFNDYLGAQQGGSFPWQVLINVIYTLLGLALAWGYAVKIYRLWIPGHGNPSDLHKVGYRAILDRLSALGYRRKRGESRESFAARMANLAPSFDQATQQHLACALGNGDWQQVDQEFDWNRASDSVLRQLDSKIPRWKKLLGILNPYSWLSTR
jgi:transglutaminase-like putative cysteine protease